LAHDAVRALLAPRTTAPPGSVAMLANCRVWRSQLQAVAAYSEVTFEPGAADRVPSRCARVPMHSKNVTADGAEYWKRSISPGRLVLTVNGAVAGPGPQGFAVASGAPAWATAGDASIRTSTS
jgi:hypothetical protein